MDTNLYTNKSIAACIKASQTLMTSHFKQLLRRIWLPLLLSAILMSVIFFINIPDKALNDIGLSHPLAAIIIMAAAYLLAFASAVWFTATVISWLREKPLKENIGRAFIVAILELAVAAVAILVNTYIPLLLQKLGMSSSVAVMVITAVVLLALLALMLPLAFSSVRYMIDHSTSLGAVFTKGYAIGIRHWGYQFLTYLAATLLAMVACFVAFIPLTVMTLAQTFNQLGMLNGDADGAPSYFIWLLAVVTIISMGLMCLITTWMLFVEYYAYGSIEIKEQERRKAKETMTATTAEA